MKSLVPVILFAFVLSSCDNTDGVKPSTEVESNKTVEVNTSSAADANALAEEPQELKYDERAEVSSDFTRAFDNRSAKISFYERCSKTTQRYTIDPAKDTLLVCDEGTTLYIEAGSFCSPEGASITAPVELSVKEFYNISDILMANLSTRSGERLLETGGMLHIEASAAGAPCELDESSFIEITMPSSGKKDDMQLFSGNWNDEGQINWQVQEDTRDLNGIVAIVDTLARFYESEAEIKSQIRQAIQPSGGHTPWTPSESVKLECVITRDGKIIDPKVLECSNEDFGKAAATAIQRFSMRPAVHNGVPVNSRMTIPIAIGVQRTTAYDKFFGTEASLYAHRSAPGNSLSNKSKAVSITDYLFRTNKLGWINCDSFIKIAPEDKTDYMVLIDNPIGLDASMVFQKSRTVLKGQMTAGGVVFMGVPINEPVQLVIIKFEGNTPHLAIHQTMTNGTFNKKLAFEEVNDEMLFAKLAEFK